MSSTSNLDVRAEQLQQVLRRVMQSVVVSSDASGLLELPLLQVRCLRVISEQEGQRLMDVAQKMKISLPGVSRTVEKLVQQGLVTRETDTIDRRAVRLQTTKPARQLLEKEHRARHAQLEACLRTLSSEALDQVLSGLEILACAAEKAQAVKELT